MFHPDYEMDRVLVLHLVDVDRDVGPLAAVRGHIGLQTDTELLDNLERRVVCNHEIGRLPPDQRKTDEHDCYWNDSR